MIVAGVNHTAYLSAMRCNGALLDWAPQATSGGGVGAVHRLQKKLVGMKTYPVALVALFGVAHPTLPGGQ